MTAPTARASEFVTPAGRPSWTVVDADGLPIVAAEQYLQSLRGIGKADNTIKTYARHLSMFWRWLYSRQLSWESMSFGKLADFLFTYRRAVDPLARANGAERSVTSTKAVAAAIKEFYEFHRFEGRGPRDLVLTKTTRYTERADHHLLAHIEKRTPAVRNKLSMGFKSPSSDTKLIRFDEDFDLLIAACLSDRDKLLVSTLYDLGFRIGQALGLRHSDLNFATSHVTAVRRDDNVNGAISKSQENVSVKAPPRFFTYYSAYLLKELMPKEIDSDYVFVNLRGPRTGQPTSYQNMYQQLVAIGARAGIPDLFPHKLRHTHGTVLAKAGWTSAEIAARLGQKHAATADRYIHLAAEDLDHRLAETQHLVWPDRKAIDE